ncbi:hypothetical protein MKW92_034992 [Papaver armeniacum]|nr:hypothetical protein MKW92_034992 [Papaver armeniacum]
MNREPANKSMGFFAIYKEAFKLTASNKKIFAQITLTILLPLAFAYLSEIRITTYSKEETPGWLDYGLTIAQILNLFTLVIFTLMSTSTIVCTVACFYTSKDITSEKVTPKLWGRLIVTFLWCFLFLAVCTFLVLGYLFVLFRSEEQRIRALLTYVIRRKDYKLFLFIICLAIPVFYELTYTMVVCNIATVVTVLEEDCYGGEALGKSMSLIEGKEWVSRAVFGLLGIAFTGVSFTYYQFVNGDDNMCLVGKLVVGIGFHLLVAICIHFLLVVHTVLYFVCKSYHNEDISTVSAQLEVPKYVQLEQVPEV